MSLSVKLRNLRIDARRRQIVDWNLEKNSIKALEEAKTEKQSVLACKCKRTTTKLIVGFLLINFTIIEIYSLIVMAIFQDLSALPVLITAIIGEVIGYAIYALKSMKENTKDGITYLKAENDLLQYEDAGACNPGEGD